jgi:hypothetical protein
MPFPHVFEPLTIRHLYTHTNGLWDHWGDELSDFEEVVAGPGWSVDVRAPAAPVVAPPVDERGA